MKRLSKWVVFAAVGLLPLLSLSAGAGTAPAARTKPTKVRTLVTTRARIYAFAQDAAAIGWIDGGARVRVRSLTSRRTWTVGKVTDEDRAAGAALALAGTRALWAWDNGGNDYGTALMTGAPGRRPVGAGGLQGGYRGFGDGERFTGLAGDGKTLAFGWASEACAGQPYGLCDLCNPLGSCPLSVTGGGVTPVTSAATRQRPVIPNIAPPAFVALSGARVAAAPARSPCPEGEAQLQSAENGPIAVYDLNGGLVTSFAPHGRVRALALSATELAVLMERANGANAIERYDPQSGRRIAVTQALRTTAPEIGVSRAGVVYRVGSRIYLFARHAAPRLVWQAKARPIGLSIEGRRVAWAENVKGRGRIVALTLPR